MKLSRRLAAAAAAAGLSDSELERRTNIPRQSISNYLGGRGVPPPDRLRTLAAVLALDVDGLLELRRQEELERKGLTLGPLAALVRSTREHQGRTVADVAAACGLSRTAYYKIESGETVAPSDETLERLGRALGVGVGDLRAARHQQAAGRVWKPTREQARWLADHPDMWTAVNELIDRFMQRYE